MGQVFIALESIPKMFAFGIDGLAPRQVDGKRAGRHVDLPAPR
jgi:hypothetical protein